MTLRSSIHNIRQKASIFAEQSGSLASLPTKSLYLSVDIAVVVCYLAASAIFLPIE
jgi:hypothetical protein